MDNTRRRQSTSSSSTKTAELDPVLHSIGFEIEEVSPSQLTGRLPVTARCCQPFKVLHGGVSALVAEGLASMGAHMASDYRRVAGVSLSINHFRSAAVGDVVLARAAPVYVGRSTQVRWQALSHYHSSSSTTLINPIIKNPINLRSVLVVVDGARTDSKQPQP
jgi:1,4-dihydroxy-2-naphthoyl-CoA hydrolase